MVALGLLLGAGLAWAGVGWDYFGAYLAPLVSAGFGAAFLHVGRSEGKERRRRLAEAEARAVRAGEPLR